MSAWCRSIKRMVIYIIRHSVFTVICHCGDEITTSSLMCFMLQSVWLLGGICLCIKKSYSLFRFFINYCPEPNKCETDTQSNLRKSLTSSWLLYGCSVGHWFTRGIDRCLAKWLVSHGIKLVLRNMSDEWNSVLSSLSKGTVLEHSLQWKCVASQIELHPELSLHSQLLLKLQDYGFQFLLFLLALALQLLKPCL